jgi:hypothetical protein
MCVLYINYMTHKEYIGFFENILPDPRSARRAEKLMIDLLKDGTVVVNKFCQTHTERIGAYRMLANENFGYEELAEGSYRFCKKNVNKKRHLLCIQDTTETNYTNHEFRFNDRDPDIGPITNKNNIGFFCHPVLVIDPENQLPLGFSSINIWNRSWEMKNRRERDYKNQDIKEKESYRWIRSAEETKILICSPTLLTIIGDRESDIYEEFVSVPDSRTHLLIRSSYDRKLYGEKQNLFEKLSTSKLRATYNIDIPSGSKRAKRTAKMSLRYERVKISHPINRKKGNKPDYVELWAIEARESPESVPEKEDPIIWRLLTTHEIKVITDALTYIEWYSQRWLIEELFHIIKTKGFCIESAQLEKGAALKKLCVMTMQAALTVMTLKLSLQNQNKIKASLIFPDEYLLFFDILMGDLEGKTAKLKNPYERGTIKWTAWAIARLGGWSGYSSQGPPGYITLKDGLDRFNDKVETYLSVMKFFNKKDVYKD